MHTARGDRAVLALAARVDRAVLALTVRVDRAVLGCEATRPGCCATVPDRTQSSALQQLEHLLGQGVGLRHHRVAGLLQDLRAAQVRSF